MKKNQVTINVNKEDVNDFYTVLLRERDNLLLSGDVHLSQRHITAARSEYRRADILTRILMQLDEIAY